MLDASSVFYMDKLVTGPAGVGVVDIRLPVAENIRVSRRRSASRSTRSSSRCSTVRATRAHRGDPRCRRGHAPDERRRRRRRHQRGAAQRPHRHVHRHRRQPEGVATTCAIKALGGHIQGRLWPRDDDEKQKGIDAGLKLDDYVYEADELVTGTNTIFVATGVTNGELVGACAATGDYVYTESVVLRGARARCAASRRSTSRRSGSDAAARRSSRGW
jgi:fructose-1,6-bisphosphatase II